MTRWKTILAAILILSLGITSKAVAKGWVFYWDGSYHGKVIDADTKEPIGGAVVIAVYKASCFRFIQTNTKEIGVQEVLTETDGTFRIPSFWTINTPDCWYDYTSFFVFKPGYGTFPTPPISGAPAAHISTPDNISTAGKSEIEQYEDIFRSGAIVEISSLKSRAELERFYPTNPVSSRRFKKKLPNYFRLKNEHRKALGFEPLEVPGD